MQGFHFSDIGQRPSKRATTAHLTSPENMDTFMDHPPTTPPHIIMIVWYPACVGAPLEGYLVGRPLPLLHLHCRVSQTLKPFHSPAAQGWVLDVQ